MAMLWPGFIALLILVPLLIGLYVWALRRRRPAGARYSSLALIKDGQAVWTLSRHQIQGRTADAVAQDIRAALTAHG